LLHTKKLVLCHPISYRTISEDIVKDRLINIRNEMPEWFDLDKADLMMFEDLIEKYFPELKFDW